MLKLLMLFIFVSCASDPRLEAQKKLNIAIDGCVIGVMEVLYHHDPDAKVPNDTIKAFGRECEQKIAKEKRHNTSQQEAFMKDFPHHWGCAVGAGSMLRTLKGQAYVAKFFLDRHAYVEEMRKYCIN